MADLLLKKIASVLLLGVAGAAAWGYLQLLNIPQVESGTPAGTQAVAAASFHAEDRAQLPVEEGPAGCRDCHPELPHWRERGRRAFLNLHTRTLDCGVCHLRGRALAVKRFRDGVALTAQTLADGEGGRLYAARKQGTAWVPVTTPDRAAQVQERGPTCTSCHRRGSPLLAAAGNFDSFRRRLLEDLEVLRRLPSEGR